MKVSHKPVIRHLSALLTVMNKVRNKSWKSFKKPSKTRQIPTWDNSFSSFTILYIEVFWIRSNTLKTLKISLRRKIEKIQLTSQESVHLMRVLQKLTNKNPIWNRVQWKQTDSKRWLLSQHQHNQNRFLSISRRQIKLLGQKVLPKLRKKVCRNQKRRQNRTRQNLLQNLMFLKKIPQVVFRSAKSNPMIQ